MISGILASPGIAFGKALLLKKDEIAAIDAKLDTMQFEVFGGHHSK